MKEIQLTQGQVAIIDDGDFGLVSKYKWCAQIHINNKQKYLGLFDNLNKV